MAERVRRGYLRSARLLTTGRSLRMEAASNERILLRGLPAFSPDPLAAVVKVEFAGWPFGVADFGSEWLDGMLCLTAT